MRQARPSAMAVLPTPASPTSSKVVLAPAAGVLDDTLDLLLAADQRVDLAEQNCWIGSVSFQGAAEDISPAPIRPFGVAGGGVRLGRLRRSVS